MYKEGELTGKIIDIAMRVHKELGAGFKESIYHNALAIALCEEGLTVESEKEQRVMFRSVLVGLFRMDLIIEKKIVLELKSITGIMPDVFQAQTISYLKASGLEIGLLINFGNSSLEVKRLAHYHDYKKSKSV